MMGWFYWQRKTYERLALLGFFYLCVPQGVEARRGYFSGVANLNDNGIDALQYHDGQGQTLADLGHLCQQSGADVRCYKMVSCTIQVSNLSDQAQKLTGFSMSLMEFATANSALSADSYDPMRNPNGVTPWIVYTANNVWTSGSNGPPSRSLFKFTHTSDDQDLVPYTSSSDMTLAVGETAIITMGHKTNWGGDGGFGINQGMIASGRVDKAFKSVFFCTGYIDIDHVDHQQPGFIVASGALDTKAGGYLNRQQRYGPSSLPAAAIPPGIGFYDYMNGMCGPNDDAANASCGPFQDTQVYGDVHTSPNFSWASYINNPGRLDYNQASNFGGSSFQNGFSFWIRNSNNFTDTAFPLLTPPLTPLGDICRNSAPWSNNPRCWGTASPAGASSNEDTNPRLGHSLFWYPFGTTVNLADSRFSDLTSANYTSFSHGTAQNGSDLYYPQIWACSDDSRIYREVSTGTFQQVLNPTVYGGTVTANWPEIYVNTPIFVNAGSPL